MFDSTSKTPLFRDVTSVDALFAHREPWMPWNLTRFASEAARTARKRQRALELSLDPWDAELTSCYCSRNGTDSHPDPDSWFVIPSPLVISAIRACHRVVHDGEMWFQILRFHEGRARVYLKYNKILGSRFLAEFEIPAEEWHIDVLDDLFSADRDYHEILP